MRWTSEIVRNALPRWWIVGNTSEFGSCLALWMPERAAPNVITMEDPHACVLQCRLILIQLGSLNFRNCHVTSFPTQMNPSSQNRLVLCRAIQPRLVLGRGTWNSLATEGVQPHLQLHNWRLLSNSWHPRRPTCYHICNKRLLKHGTDTSNLSTSRTACSKCRT